MLRFHFTGDDLGRTRIATTPDPMWEILLSLYVLQVRDASLVFDHWRRKVQGRLGGSTRMLLDLVPPRGYTPDFLTPAGGSDTLGQGIEQLAATPRRVAEAHLAELAGERSLPAWTRDFAAGRAPARRKLAGAVSAYHHAAIAPVWDQIRSAFEADRVRRAQLLADHGIERLLSDLHPLTRWRPPVLEVAYPYERDVQLDGRGMLLVPAYFCWGAPIALRDRELPPLLVLPIPLGLADTPAAGVGVGSAGPATVAAGRAGIASAGVGAAALAPDGARRGQSLVALLGRTRAAVLGAVVAGAQPRPGLPDGSA